MNTTATAGKSDIPPEPGHITIGSSDGKLRILAFSAGGADNVFLFGTVHAFLVANSEFPHIITGVSAGGVVGAALADVLQAGDDEDLNTPKGKDARRLAQVARFRGLLNQVERSPGDIVELCLPDLTEVTARGGLVPLEAPALRNLEREERNRMALARFGLIALFNGLLSSRLQISDITRLVRLLLEWPSLGEWKSLTLRKWCGPACAKVLEPAVQVFGRFWILVRVWLHSLVPLLRDAPLLTRLLSATSREWIMEFDFLRWILARLGFARLRSAKHLLFEPVALTIARFFFVIFSYPIVLLFWLFLPPAGLGLALIHLLARQVPSVNGRKAFLVGGLLLTCIGSVAIVLLYPSNSHLLALLLWHPALNWDLVQETLSVALADWFGIGLAASGLVALGKKNAGPRDLFMDLLQGYNLKRDLLTTGVLKRLISRAFDPNYWGSKGFSSVLEEALYGTAPSGKETHLQRTLGSTLWNGSAQKRKKPILFTPVAANLADGKLTCIHPSVSLIDALSATCAFNPWFAPQKIGDKWMIDGACVGLEPLQPIIDLVKSLYLNTLNFPSCHDLEWRKVSVERLRHIELCVVSPFPTRQLLNKERQQILTSMGMQRGHENPTQDEARRSFFRSKPLPEGILFRLQDILWLQSAHAAKDERHLIQVYNLALEKQGRIEPLFCSDPNNANCIENWHAFVHLREIEPRKPIRMLGQLGTCSDGSAVQKIIRRVVADGCRASLCALYKNQFRLLPRTRKSIPPCRALRDALGASPIPGSSPLDTAPPGIAEVCRECIFAKDPRRSWHKLVPRPESASQTGEPPDWPTIPTTEPQPDTNPASTPPPATKAEPLSPPSSNPQPSPRSSENAVEEIWPRQGPDEPTVSLIFSGGVFRGVFQIGVLNALSEAGLKPDLIAGASVGTIMGGLAARVFSISDKDLRRKKVAAVAATFLAIDRLILTDRFADFIRRFTLRGGGADFSLRDADHLFRRFDRRNWELLTRRSRRVVAGIHRLTYLDPLELLDLLGANSPRRKGELAQRLLFYSQDGLNRAGIGTEVLGAEPLELLIREHILSQANDRGAQFDEFLRGESRIQFLATTTNLTTGELDLLGSFGGSNNPALIPGLLASSAFPGVFRPRLNWEVRASSGLPEELIDGGIADNLPFLPVIRFLFLASQKGWIKPRLQNRPHLLLTASLEPRREDLEPAALEKTVESWMDVSDRVRQLRYNVKVDTHQKTQENLRKIYAALTPPVPHQLLNLHTICVKPEWLPGTFAFHPMLGFRRRRQAQSIAHGCAMTLANLYLEQNDHLNWSNNWWDDKLGFNKETLCMDGSKKGAFFLKPLTPLSGAKPGDCHFRLGRPCPFSQSLLKDQKHNSGLKEETIAALNEIYVVCGEQTTHARATGGL